MGRGRMNRNQYDSDITTWSPQGRIFQIEYAMNAVTQGSAAIGLRSKDYVVLVSLKRSASELATHQRKIFRIDDHMGIGIAGLAADARVLSNFMRTECLQHKYVFDSPIQSSRLVNMVADKAQVKTQRYGKRPYGVGLLVAAYDRTGAHLYELNPSGNFSEYYAMAIGARAQSAKTYLEKKFEEFSDASLDQLIHHGLFALRETSGQQSEGLTMKNTSVAVVGRDKKFTIIENEDVKPYLDALM